MTSLGNAKVLNGPVSPSLEKFYYPDLPVYPLDLARAEALLDEAGYPRRADGTRFEVFLDPVQAVGSIKQTAEYLVQVRSRQLHDFQPTRPQPHRRRGGRQQ